MRQNNNPVGYQVPLNLWLGIAGVVVGTVVGFMSGAQPTLIGLAIAAVAILVYFFSHFEQAVLGMLVFRSSLDVLSDFQIPAAFAIGLDALTLLYVTLMLLTGHRIKTDNFWWFFAAWVAFQSLWVILLPLGGLGLDGSYLTVSLREWVRLFSWLMVYLLVMQLKDEMTPQQIINVLFLSLILPLTMAMVQIVIPNSVLPEFLRSFKGGERINGSLGHPNSFATFLTFFIGLTYWKWNQSKSSNRWLWLVLLGTLFLFLITTKALVGLVMSGILGIFLIFSRITPAKLIGGIVIFAGIIIIFGSTEFGRERLALFTQIPIINPDIDVSRAIVLRFVVDNSFYWRLEQWTYLLRAWRESPLFGMGLDTSPYLTHLQNAPHNDYVRALVEEGIVGLFAFLTFMGVLLGRLIYFFRVSPPGSDRRELCFVLIGIEVAILVGMITENIWSHTVLFFYWFTVNNTLGWNWEEQRHKLEENQNIIHYYN